MENENWMNVKTIHQNESTIHSLKPDKNSNDAITSYSTNREKIYHKNAATIEEVHILESSGRTTKNFAEEHWSSKIKSYVMPQPPKFIQIIKAFRVLATDTLTLVVEVQSDPPAIFEWFYNDKPAQQNRRKFKARHGINITTLTVEGPEQGVYKCTARNPVGISTTYGYVTVNAPPSYKAWLEQAHEVDEKMSLEIIDKENTQASTDKPPKFIQQIPNLTLRPGNEAVVDVEVEASPPAKFTWYVNGIQFRDTVGQIEVYYPAVNRCIARFPIPQKGEYKVIAENRAGKEHSIGYIDIKKEVIYHQAQLPPLPNDHMYHHHSLCNDSEYLLQGRGRASSLSRTVDFYEESSYYERSTSLPRQIDRPYEIKKTAEMFRKCKNDSNQLQQERQEQQQYREQQYSSSRELAQTEGELPLKMKRRRYSETVQRLIPQTPIFTNKLPTEVMIGSDEDLVLSVGIKAVPRADVKWSMNGFELKDSKKITVISDEDHSTLVVRPPVRYGRYCVVATNEYGMSNQSTRVHHDEEKQYEEEFRESHSLPPEITGNLVSTCTTNVMLNGWELLDEHQRSSRSTDSFETIKHVGIAQVPTEGHQTPIQRYVPATVEQFRESSGGKNTVNYEAPTIPQQPLPKLMIPVIHEPQGENISIVSEASRRSSYTEKRCEETTSGIIYETLSPKLAKPILHKSLTDMTFAKQRWEKTVHTRNENTIHKIPSSKLQSRKEITDDGIIEKKVFRIPAHHNVEPIPKQPFILKQPEPEIRLKAGEKLVLESKVDSSPASEFRWYQNNFEVRPTPSVIIESPAINESRVTFLKPVSGIYKIVASNIHGSCSSTTHVSTEITEEWATESAVSVERVAPEKQEPKYQLVKKSHIGTRNDLPKAPRIVEGFAPFLKIANNEPLVLRVTADAIPEAEFRWMLNNFEVRTSQTIAIQRLGPNVSQVTFYSPISGRYEVIATNSLGQDFCSGKIVIDYAEEVQVVPIQRVKKPAVPKIPVFINALPGETQLPSEEQEFRLSVSVRGEQPITFRWFADGSLLSNSVEHQMINDLENSTLVVRKQIGCDVDYAIEVSNAHGAAWSETTVKPPLLTASLVTSTTSWESSLLEMDDAQRCSPRYTTVLTDKNLQQNGEFITYVAISEESSPCEFVWTLNGRDIRTIPGFHVKSTSHESTLHVKSVLLKHSGELSVVASNKYGTARSAAKINVHSSLEESYEFISEAKTIRTKRPPRIVSPLQPFVFRAGESLELRCHVDALPRPEIFWTKDGIRIDDLVSNKEFITLQHPDGRYELINPKCAPEDAGLYQLTARNIHGVTNTSAYIQIMREEMVETTTGTEDEVQLIHRATLKPRFSEVLSKECEDKMVVSCKVISETPVLISWYKDGQQLYQTYKYRMQKLNDNTHILTICSVDRWDEGTYTCYAENEYGCSETGIYIRPSVKTREISEEVLVEENDSEVIGLQDNIGYKYTDTTVKVLTEPTISGSQEMYSHTAELRKSEEQYKLLVKVAEIVASKLIAKVIIDEAIHIALRQMNVEVLSSEEEEFEQHPCPPRFETNIECYIVDVGDAVVLRTDISGYPQPCVEWYFDEQKLEQSERMDVKYVNKQATLRIKKVEKKDEGTYYCHAENEYGKAILPCSLCVIVVGQESSESVHKMIRPLLTYTLSETETEVSSDVHVTHAVEFYDNYFSFVQPETFALGYSCLASTSKVHGDSVIITRESVQKAIETEQEAPEAYIILNVNVERTPALLKHDVHILQSTDERVIISHHEPRYTSTEEVIQTNNILLIGDQRILQQYQFMVNTTATVIFEKPSQRALHEVICLYDEKVHVSKEKIQAASTIDLRKVEIVNELISTIMAAEETFRKAYAEANVSVRRPDAVFDHFITVIQSEHEHLKVHLFAPVLVKNFATFDFHFQQKQESLRAEFIYVEHLRRNATAEQKIILLESSFQKFSETITWSLKKISKEAAENDIAHTNIKVHKPEEIGEHATTIVDTRKIVAELLAIAAAASKLKLTSIFVTFTKKGDMAHQALVIQYESFVEDEAVLNVAMLTAPGFRSKQESVWSYGKKCEKAEEIEANVVAVFVEVDATCPNQTIELVASVSLPPSIPGIMDATRSSQPLLEPSSVSWSESSSTGLLQVPKFIKTLENTTAIVGQFHQFKCIVSGTPAPRIRWFVDGDVIHDSDVYQTIYEDGVCILKIRELAIEDEGEYVCEAINDAGRTITKCFLQTMTEADVLKYQQQAMFENILYSNGGNNNNKNDNLASLDNISSLSNADRVMYRNHASNCNDLIERDGNSRKHHLIVNYEFVQTEPVSAETVVIVTRYTSSKKDFRKNFASEERSFNISVFLPNAATECAFIWAVPQCENIELFLIPSFQTTNLVIQKFQSQQTQKADFLLSRRKLLFENVSFAICQPWEEILLVKKPESAFIWDNEYYRRQKARVKVSIKSSNENGYSQNQHVKNIAMRTDCLNRSLHSYFDVVREDSATSLASQTNSILQMKESTNISEKAKNEQNEEMVRYKDEQDEEQIPIPVQEIIHEEKEVDVDIPVRDDDNKFKYELSRQTSKEYSGISISDIAAIRRYVDELLDFDQAMPISTSIDISSYKQRDINKSNTTDSQIGNALDFVNEKYLDCSFNRRSEHVQATENRNSSTSVLGIRALSDNHLTANFSSNPNSKNMTSNKKSIESKTIVKSNVCKVDCDSAESSKENLSNPASKKYYNKVDTCSSFNTSDMQPHPNLSTEIYPLHINSTGSVDTGATFGAIEEFEVLNASVNSRLQHNIGFSISPHPNISNFCVQGAEHSKSHVNAEFVNTSTSNTRISSEESLSVHDSTADELLSEIGVIDKVRNKVRTKMKMKSEGNEVLQIERAIYDISEQIERQQPLTEAQAEASEELLKTILENIIKNAGEGSAVETMVAYKKPVILLREKLTDLEEALLREVLESRNSSKSIPKAEFIFSKSLNEEDLFAKSVQKNSIERKIRGASLCGLRQAGIIDKEDIKRMTPLTSNIKEQLQSLECMLEEVEKEEKNGMNELIEETKVTVPVCADDKQHEVHNILMQINNEISIIKRCCQRNISKTSVDVAVRLLHKVRNNVSSMIDLISLYRKRFKKKSPAEKGLNSNKERMKLSRRTSHHLSPFTKTGFFFKTDASVNLYLVKREESEIITAIVKLCISSDKTGNQMLKSKNSEISTYEDAVFDDKSKTLQETRIDDAMRTVVSKPATEKDGKFILSSFDESQSSSFSLRFPQNLQASLVPRRMNQQRADSLPPISSPSVSPPHMRHRSKSCNDYKNLIIRYCAFDTENNPLPILQNMATSMHKRGEVSQLDAPIYANDRFDPVNVMDLEDIKESDLLTFEQKSKKLNEKAIRSERIIRKEGSCYSCSYTWPSKVEYRISLEMFDESSSIQLVCEDSDYAPESVMHSLLLFESTNKVQEENDEELLQTLAFLSDLNASKAETVAENITKRQENFAELRCEREEKKSTTPELDESYNQNISEYLSDMGQKINENSKTIENPRSSSSEDDDFENIQKPVQHFRVSLNTKTRGSLNALEDDTNSLHEIESIDDKDEILDELDDLMVICNPHTSVIDGIDLLPTIMEDSENFKVANSSMSISTNTVVAVSVPSIDVQEKSQNIQKMVIEDGEKNDITTLKSSLEFTAKTVNVPLIRSDKDEVNYLNSCKRKVILVCENDSKQVSEETTINVIYKSCSSKLKVLAILSPEVRAKAEAYLVIGESFDVLIEQPDDAQDFTVKLLDRISDSVSLDLMLPNTIEVDLSLTRNGQCEGILSYQVRNPIGNENEERISMTSDDEHHHHHHHSSEAVQNKERRTGISVNIIARSVHDIARALLEEVPWGEVSMYIVMQPIMTRSTSDSGTRNSVIQNVTVSESNETEKRSLHSHESFRSSSQQSFDWTEFSDQSASWQNLNVPSYVVREGSTATITCEFNNFLTPGSLIDWFKGKTVMQIIPGKIDRISHDLLEVLVISHVNLMDGDVYSIRVNDVIYPVACLIVENVDISSEKLNDDVHFISPPQTLFVMEGQPSIISCQVSSANQKIEWCKDNKKWVTENERIRLEADEFGSHRIIIDKSELEDQGTYYAFLGDNFTTVTLVVEERIDEREVTISALGTDIKEDDYREYLVPLGSTATIACELENSDEVQELVWRKDGIQIEFSDDSKVEHVVNGLKHYLVIHDTQANDSASYSICINDIEFKIAHLIVSSCATVIGSKHTIRISRNSLH